MTENQELELEFLRFFYANVDNALGPASDDIYDYLKQDFLRENPGKRLPSGYGTSWED